MNLEFLVRNKERVNLLSIHEKEFLYEDYILSILTSKMNDDDMFYNYVSNYEFIKTTKIIERLDASSNKIYLGLNDDTNKHGFSIKPVKLSKKEKYDVIKNYVFSNIDKLLLTDGTNNLVVMNIKENLGNYESSEVIRLDDELTSLYYFERAVFDKVNFDYIKRSMFHISKSATFSYNDLLDIVEKSILDEKLNNDKQKLQKILKNY